MPMVDGVQPYSLAQAAAATLKLVRSAHNSTLPAKKTVAVTPQLIGRESRPFEPVLADMAFLPEILFVPRPLAGRRKVFDGATQVSSRRGEHNTNGWSCPRVDRCPRAGARRHFRAGGRTSGAPFGARRYAPSITGRMSAEGCSAE